MQCLGGCFAREALPASQQPQKPSTAVSSYTADDASSAGGTWTSEPVLVHITSGAGRGAAKGQGAKSRLGLESGTNSSQAQAATSLDSDRELLREQYLLQHGRNILAVSTLQQEELQHFVMPGIGYIGYALMFNGPEFLNKRTAVVLSDPVCHPQHYKAMAAAFLQEHPQAMFAQVSAEFAAVLQDGHSFSVNSMGGETRLDLASYNFTGYARRGLRSAITSATKEGIRVQEVMQPPPVSLGTCAVTDTSAGDDAAAVSDAGVGSADWAAVAQEMRAVDDKWVASKGPRARDFWFINRRPVFAPEPGVRKFVARDASGALQGYIFFDGIFEGGRLVGYYANVTRMLPEAHPGTLNLMVKTFIETVRSEAHLAAPTKKLSVRRSLRKKQQAAAAAAAAAGTPPDAPAAGSAADQDAAAAASPAAAATTTTPAGPQFLSLGLSPLFQMDSRPFNADPAVAKVLTKAFEAGEPFYPFRTLAAAKAKYGAGLHEGKYEDAAVEYRQTYLCQRRGKGAVVALFDMAKLCGLWKHPADAAARLIKYKIRSHIAKRSSSSSFSSDAGRPSARSGSSLLSSSSTCASTISSAAGSRVQQGVQGMLQKDKQAVAAAGAGAGVAAVAGAVGAAAVGRVAPSLASNSTVSLIGTAPNPGAAGSAKLGGSSDSGSDNGDLPRPGGIAAGGAAAGSVVRPEITACEDDGSSSSPSWRSSRSTSSSVSGA